jgi:iron complex transport system permease protein
MWSLGALLVVAAVLAISVGPVDTGPRDVLAALLHLLGLDPAWSVDSQQQLVITQLRFPRVILGVLVGSGLAVCGTAMQGLFRNALADPALIGVSAGAAAAVVATIVLGHLVATSVTTLAGGALLPLVAFAGALGTALLVHRLSLAEGRTVVTTMVLVGVGVNALAGAFTGLLIHAASDTELRTVTFWSLGSLGGASWRVVMFTSLPILVAVLMLPRTAAALNAIALGESEASHLGVDVERVKRIVICAVALGVGAAVSVCGIIGFVGLVVPHIARMAVGADHRVLFRASGLIGAILLVLADVVARTIAAPAELPIGILTACFGAPFLIWLLRRSGERERA